MHSFVRAFHGDSYLEYVGGPPLETLSHRMIVGIVYVLSPLLSLLHVWQAPLVNPVIPMIIGATELSVVALLHDAVADDMFRELPGSQLSSVFLASIGIVAAWVLLLETLNRFFMPLYSGLTFT